MIKNINSDIDFSNINEINLCFNLNHIHLFDIKNKNSYNIEEQLDLIFNDWEEYYNVLAYYIEHDELEKVETELTRLKSYYDSKMYDEIEKTFNQCDIMKSKMKRNTKILNNPLFINSNGNKTNNAYKLIIKIIMR